jgi:hypothetical protein
MPVVVYMGYSVHGNEASGTEAAVLLLYHLAAGNGAPVDSILQDAPASDPADREHNEPWPGGRTNHYWFDLNRDWLLGQLKESQGRLDLFHKWRPQLQTDYHEMSSDSTFFFQPGVPTRNNPNIPKRTFSLTEEVASYHAKALDELGSLYYSEEGYDDFYPGKGSTYPDLNGAVGILFEQASSRSILRETSTGVMDFGFTVRNQLAASLSSLQAAVSMKTKLLAHQRDFYLEAGDIARANPVKAYVIGVEGGRAAHLLEVLLRHRIRVYQLGKDVEIDGITYKAAEAYIVPTAQPQTRLVKVLLERASEFGDPVFYDISAWTLPLAMGLSASELSQDPGPYFGSEVEVAPSPRGILDAGEAKYAYLLDWNTPAAPEALYRVLDAGIMPRLMKKPSELDLQGKRQTLDRSTVIIPVSQRGVPSDVVHSTIQEIVRDHGVHVKAADTGFSSSGPDLGGPSSTTLEKPIVALLSGPGTRSYYVGETWFVLNERTGIPVSLLDVSRITSSSLSRYNRIVAAGSFSRNNDEGVVTTLKDWIRRGGVLIAFHTAAQWAIQQKLIEEEMRDMPSEDLQANYEDSSATRRSQSIPGSIFGIKVDTTHPVAFGIQKESAVFRNHSFAVEPSKSLGANVAVYSESPLLSGYAPKNKLEPLAGSAAVIARRVGSGAVILFVDNPNFRAFWFVTSRMFLNSVFFGRAF